MIIYDLYRAVSTICANRSNCSGVRADSRAFGNANRSSTEASERGDARCDWLSGVIPTFSRAALSFGRRSERYRTSVSMERLRSSVKTVYACRMGPIAVAEG